jgi:hypothetical protein
MVQAAKECAEVHQLLYSNNSLGRLYHRIYLYCAAVLFRIMDFSQNFDRSSVVEIPTLGLLSPLSSEDLKFFQVTKLKRH